MNPNMMNPMAQMYMEMAGNGQMPDNNRNNNNTTSCPPPPIPPHLNSIGGPPPPLAGPPPPTNPNVLAMQIEGFNSQQNTLRDQIQQSEQNLKAQHTALIAQQDKAIEELPPYCAREELQKSASQENIDLEALDLVLKPIIDSCTKDNISAGKNWILQYSTSPNRAKVALQYLLQK